MAEIASVAIAVSLSPFHGYNDSISWLYIGSGVELYDLFEEYSNTDRKHKHRVIIIY